LKLAKTLQKLLWKKPDRTAAISVLVIGKAKTGTTYLSKLLQNSISESVLIFEPKDYEAFLPRSDSAIQPRNVVTKIIFEHLDSKPNLRLALMANELPFSFDKKILLLRDPRDELISRLLYIIKPLKDHGSLSAPKLDKWLEVIRRKEESPSSLSIMEMIRNLDSIFGTQFMLTFLKHLDDYTAFFQNKAKHVYAYRYEDLVDRKVSGLEEYLGFSLNFDLERDAQIQRTLRSGTYGNWKRIFTASDIDELSERMGPFIELIGYDDWELTPVDSLDSPEFSGYVQTLSNSD